MSLLCSVEGCGRPHRAKGFCSSHYARMYTRVRGRGTLDPVGSGCPIPTIERVRAKIKVVTGCWLFLGKLDRGGYARIRDGTKYKFVHKFMWEMRNGPTPVGLELDHLCRNRHCCNPAHLEPVTHSENMRRGCWKSLVAFHSNPAHQRMAALARWQKYRMRNEREMP